MDLLGLTLRWVAKQSAGLLRSHSPASHVRYGVAEYSGNCSSLPWGGRCWCSRRIFRNSRATRAWRRRSIRRGTLRSGLTGLHGEVIVSKKFMATMRSFSQLSDQNLAVIIGSRTHLMGQSFTDHYPRRRKKSALALKCHCGSSRSDMELRLRKNSRGSFAKPRSSRSSTSARFLRAAAIHSFGAKRWNGGSPKTAEAAYRWNRPSAVFERFIIIVPTSRCVTLHFARTPITWRPLPSRLHWVSFLTKQRPHRSRSCARRLFVGVAPPPHFGRRAPPPRRFSPAPDARRETSPAHSHGRRSQNSGGNAPL